jgi:hypothetical protein
MLRRLTTVYSQAKEEAKEGEAKADAPETEEERKKREEREKEEKVLTLLALSIATLNTSLANRFGGVQEETLRESTQSDSS